MSRCTAHSKKIEYFCLKPDCEAKSSAMCETCLSTLHNHPQHNSLRIQPLVQLFADKERPSQNQHFRKKLRFQFGIYMENLRESFNKQMATLTSHVDEYIKNMQCYNGYPMTSELYSTIALIRSRKYDQVKSAPLLKLMTKQKGTSDITGRSPPDFSNHLKSFLSAFKQSITNLNDSIKKIGQGKTFQIFQLDSSRESPELAQGFSRVLQLINIQMSGPKDADKNQQSLRLTKKAYKAEQAGNKEEAIKLYTLALDINGKNYAARNNLGLLLKQTGDLELAIQQFEQASIYNSTWPVPYVNKGNCYRSLGNPTQALIAYDSALKLDSKFYSALYNKAVTLQTIGRSAESLQIVQKLKGQSKKQDLDLQILEGLCNSSTGNYTRAIQIYDKILASNPKCDEALYNKSFALEKLNRKAEAYVTMKLALELRPEDREYKLRLNSLK